MALRARQHAARPGDAYSAAYQVQESATMEPSIEGY
jgi:hypothetical protein